MHVGCDCFNEEADFGRHLSYPWRHGDCLSWGVAFENPQMVAVLPGPTRGRKVIGHQDTTIEELAGKDLVGEYL